MNRMSKIGKIISTTRKNRNLTQMQLAEKSGVDYNAIIKIEGGKVAKPRTENIQSIAKALDVPESYLTGETLDEGFRAQVEGRDVLPLTAHSDKEFERMIFMLIEQAHKDWKNAEHYGGIGDKGRDIIARALRGSTMSKQFTFFQAKKHKRARFNTLTDDMDKIHQHFFIENTNKVKQPERIIFCVGCEVGPELKDKVREYGREKGLPECVVWGALELDPKCRANTNVMNEFFGGHIQEVLRDTNVLRESNERIERDVKNIKDAITQQSAPSNDQQDISLRRALRLVKEDKFAEALEILFPLKKELEEKKDTTKLHEVYNNIGVCHANDAQHRNWETAIEYFQRALESKPDFEKAASNLAIAYLNSGKKESWEKALVLAKEKFEQLPLESGFVTFYLLAMDRLAKEEELKTFLLDHANLRERAVDNAELSAALGHAHLRTYNYDDAISIAEDGINKFPNSCNLHLVLGRALLYRADRDDRTDNQWTEVTPRFNDEAVIVKAKKHLERALELARAEKQPKSFTSSIILDLLSCSHILHDESFGSIRDQIDMSAVPEGVRRQVNIREFGRLLDERSFEAAYLKLRSDEEFWSKGPYGEFRRLAAIFFENGSPEYAIRFLENKKDEALQVGDEQYWILMATSYALLGKKTEALSMAEEAKRIFTGKEQYKKVLPFYGGMMARYSRDGEPEKMLGAMQELQAENPEKRIVWPMKALEEDGSPSKEVIDFFKKSAQDYKMKKEGIMGKRLPLYMLQRMFNRPFPEAILIPAAEGDFDFVLPYTFANKEFLEPGKDAFEKAEKVMLDYAALYNLAKARCLGLLQMSKKKVLIHKKLFQQIQDDLMQNEDQTVREIWNFIRDASVEHVTEKAKSWKIFPKKSTDIFDEWLIETLEVAREKELLLICDDMNLLRMTQGKGLHAISSFCVLQWSETKSLLDKKHYALALASLAELFYAFIPFNGKDLFYIAIDDQDKVQWKKISSGYFDRGEKVQISHRFFHLINQVRLPGSDLHSFLATSLNFIEELAKTGVLFSEKTKYLHFFTTYFTNWLREKITEDQVEKESLDLITRFFARIWNAVTVHASSPEEIEELKQTAREAFRDRSEEGKLAALPLEGPLGVVLEAIDRHAATLASRKSPPIKPVN